MLAIAGLNVFLLEGRGSGHVVQLVVEAAGVADGLPVGVAAPQGRGVGAAVCAGRSFTLRRALKEKEMVIFMDKGLERELPLEYINPATRLRAGMALSRFLVFHSWCSDL